MDIAKRLTPKETEEVKPGLFIQKKGNKYRQIYPAAWNGEINWKNFVMGNPRNFLKSLILFAIIILVILSYIHDTRSLKEFQTTVNLYKSEWCSGISYEDLRGGAYENNNTIYNNYG